jgi:hypothetical protein
MAAAPALGSCTQSGIELTGTSTFAIVINKVNGASPPAADAPLPANRGDKNEMWEVSIEARTPEGDLAPFEGMVRLSVEPGAVVEVEDQPGRNVLLTGGRATAKVFVTAVYGPTRLWVEDVGYVPATADHEPACANGRNDDKDEDVLIDFPADPGCAFANDDTEEEGTFAAGVSPPVAYALPTLRDLQGEAAITPYPLQGMEVNTSGTREVIVTRLASDGFYATDVTDQADGKGYNHIFAFNFNTPSGMRVCDRVVYLAGTVSEFFGFTELSFPSYRLIYPHEGDFCNIPEPVLLDGKIIDNPIAMEKNESGLVRVRDVAISKYFGSGRAFNYDGHDKTKTPFSENESSCDLNADGQVDFDNDSEAKCANACSANADCTEWTGYSARGNFKVHSLTDESVIQLNLGSVPLFDPVEHKGQVLKSVTGTLRNFSGGSLNWTIETRCPDDLVCDKSSACAAKELPSSQACVRLRSIDDNDEGTN